MKVPTLLQSHMEVNQQASPARGLYSATSLENRLLAQASGALPGPLSNPSSWVSSSSSSSIPSLQPSSLSSTKSTFLSSAPTLAPSSLLSTQNTLLKTDALLFPTLSSSVPSPHARALSLCNSPAPSTGLHPPGSSLLPSRLPSVPPGEERRDGGERRRSSEDVPSCGEEMSVDSDQGGPSPEENGASAEMPVLNMELRDEELEQPARIGREEFGEMERGEEHAEDEMKEKKYLLLNEVCCSLVNKTTGPGQTGWDEDDTVWTRIKNLAKDISNNDPQFLLKVAVYTRQELNIRVTANFLLALAASLPATKTHVRRYFCAAVQLPSDWLEVARLYSTCFSQSLPSCLKKGMADKFKHFNEHQLAKYNTRKHRCKHNRKRPKKAPSAEELEKWAKTLRSHPSVLLRYLKMDEREAVDKKQSEFNLKKMIKKLHIKEPAQHVMAVLGMRYPGDVKAFSASGLRGAWDRERAGRRMRLVQPDTWERKLSQEGNKAATWEKLIDNKSLPFMAMLRNLRNMIMQGISEKHHQKILARLTNKKAVIQSRQFPFRFLAAYKVLMELSNMGPAGPSKKAVPSSKETLRSILESIPRSKRHKNQDFESAKRNRLKATLGVPFIYRLYQMKRRGRQRASQKADLAGVLERYRRALETALQISCRHNVPPLPGRTLVLVSAHLDQDDWSPGREFYCPRHPEEEEEGEEEEEEGEEVEEEEDGEREGEEDEGEGEKEEEEKKEGEKKEERHKKKKVKLSASLQEMAVLLSLMVDCSAEDAQLVLCSWNGCKEVELKSDVLLDNVSHVMRQVEEFRTNYDAMESASKFISKVCAQKTKVDNVIVVADHDVSRDIDLALSRYRKESNQNLLVVKVYLQNKTPNANSDVNCVELFGFSEQILRFVAERGSSRLLEHVEHMDRLHSVPAPPGARETDTAAALTPLPASPRMRWRGVRVFISSTFRDMHGERDVLVRSVFPELRRRCAAHRLHLQEVELRWGVTEEESGRAVQLCLSEVCRSQMLVGILGERYGLVPPRPALPDLPQYGWLDFAPPGLSITEMEIRQFQALYPDSAHHRMFCYFRAPHPSRTVPVSWRSDFAPESKEAESKMSDLKRRILDSDVKVTEDYPWEWGGVVDGKPYVKGLEDFGKAVLEDLWAAVMKQFVEEAEEADPRSDVSRQEAHHGALQRLFYGRARRLAEARGKVKEAQLKGGLLVLEGAPGEGKSVFMAALANALRTPEKKSQKASPCDVISYSTDVSQSACGVEGLLRCLVQWLRGRKDTGEDSPLPLAYKDLLAEFHSQLSDTKKDQPLALLVDAADLIQDGRGQLMSDWIPQQLPPGVSLVVSVTSNSVLLHTLSQRKGAVVFPLGQLSLPDRKEIVQKELAVYGKKLSDSAFNNQLQTLLMKKGAISPLFLHLACEDLRSFASFEKMTENLQSLPQSLCQLVQHSLARLLSQFSQYGEGLHWALAAFTVSTAGLRERDLYALLNMSHDLPAGKPMSWQHTLQLARNPPGRIPMATFSHMVRSLESLIGPSYCHGQDDLLALTNPEVRRAFELLLLPGEAERTRAHSLLAAHLWVLADPQDKDTFLHCEASSISHLPLHLMRSGQWVALSSLLSSYYFLFANMRHGLLHHLLTTYSSLESEADQSAGGGGVEDCRGFLRRHAPLLSSWPALFVQQALNEPRHTSAHLWAQGLMGKGVGVQAVQWLNNTERPQKPTSELVSTFSREPTCVGVSPGGAMMAVGTEQGTLHLLHTHTGQEVRSLVSSCDGISGCIFLGEELLGTTSFDGRIEIWDVEKGCRTALLDGHSNRITGSDTSRDRKHLVTVSLDFNLKVWSSPTGRLLAALQSPSPLNCVTFDPEGDLVAAGCWDGSVRVWNWPQERLVTSLSGHARSVRSVSFSPSSSPLLCSGSLSGEVRLWSVAASACVGRYQAHHGATAALSFLQGGAVLLSAGSDRTVQLWSGGLGRTLKVFGEKQGVVEPGDRGGVAPPAALCVAVSGDDVAVGYHGDGLKLFSLESGERTWASEDLRLSVLCLMWLVAKEGAELLVTGGGDHRLRVWRKEERGGERSLALLGQFGLQRGPVLALALSSTHLASASDDFTIALWPLENFTSDPWVGPQVELASVLRGHSGAVTCLAFSPTGGELLSGGKDQALMVWSCSPPGLSKSLPHSHGDWITGCAWTQNCVVSCSRDCRVRVWDLQTGRSVRELHGTSAFSSVSCLGDFVVAGCSEGVLQLWTWASGMEISRIAAHRSCIHHCSVLHCSGKSQAVAQEDMTASTASDDGSVKLWKPFQVHHHSTLQGHSGGIRGVVSKQEGVPAFVTVSEDRSLRSWNIATAMESPPNLRGAVSALSFSQGGEEVLVGYESGQVEVWQQNSVVGRKQVSDSGVSSMCSMPGGQFAVGCRQDSVSVWRLEWNPTHTSAGLWKVSSYTVGFPAVHLHWCSMLLGVSAEGLIVHVDAREDDRETRQIHDWNDDVRVLGMIGNDEKSVWLLAETSEDVVLGFTHAMGRSDSLRNSFSSAPLDMNQPERQGGFISAITVEKDLVVCGDSKGNMWFNRPPDLASWSTRKPAHSDRISVLRVTRSTIISASYDRTVKLWDRNTKKQVGMFVCGGPVLVLEVSPRCPRQLVCGDGLGAFYSLSWRE